MRAVAPIAPAAPDDGITKKSGIDKMKKTMGEKRSHILGTRTLVERFNADLVFTSQYISYMPNVKMLKRKTATGFLFFTLCPYSYIYLRVY